MRIAVYHNEPPGGARRAMLGFCQELLKRHHVEIYTLSTADQSMLNDQDVATSVHRLPFSPRPPVRMGMYLNDFRRWQNATELQDLNASVAARIDSDGHDVVLVDACRFTYAPQLLQHLRTPAAYYCHHRPQHLGEPSPAGGAGTLYGRGRDLWHRPIQGRLERWLWWEDYHAVRSAHAVLTNSEFNAQWVREVYGILPVVCSPGVDMPQTADPEGSHLLAVGALGHHKGFDFIIDALALVPEALRPPLHIAATADNAYVRSRLGRQAQEKGIRLKIGVGLQQTALAAEYRGALVFLWASRKEALGLAPLEAMAHSVPVVAVADGGVLETVIDGRTGWLVQRSPADFAARVVQLLSSAELRRSMGAAARAEVEANWAWPRRAAALEAELVKLAARTSATRTPTAV